MDGGGIICVVELEGVGMVGMASSQLKTGLVV